MIKKNALLFFVGGVGLLFLVWGVGGGGCVFRLGFFFWGGSWFGLFYFGSLMFQHHAS